MRFLVVGAVALVLAGCGGGGGSHSSSASSGSSASSSAAAPATPNTIQIKSFSFSPSPITVAPGTVVTVSNQDAATHTVTSSAFDTGRVSGHSSATFTAPTAPGTYAYHCNIHQYMKATLIVT